MDRSFTSTSFLFRLCNYISSNFSFDYIPISELYLLLNERVYHCCPFLYTKLNLNSENKTKEQQPQYITVKSLSLQITPNKKGLRKGEKKRKKPLA